MFKKKNSKSKKDDDGVLVEADTVETNSSDKSVKDGKGLVLSKDEINLVRHRLEVSEDLQLFLKVQRGAAEFDLFRKLSE